MSIASIGRSPVLIRKIALAAEQTSVPISYQIRRTTFDNSVTLASWTNLSTMAAIDETQLVKGRHYLLLYAARFRLGNGATGVTTGIRLRDSTGGWAWTEHERQQDSANAYHDVGGFQIWHYVGSVNGLRMQAISDGTNPVEVEDAVLIAIDLMDTGALWDHKQGSTDSLDGGSVWTNADDSSVHIQIEPNVDGKWLIMARANHSTTSTNAIGEESAMWLYGGARRLPQQDSTDIVDVYDEFNDAAGTNLNSHTASSGAAWTKYDGSGSAIEIATGGNNCALEQISATNEPWYYYANNMFDLDLRFTVDVDASASNNWQGVFWRLNSATAYASRSAYGLRYDTTGTDQWELLRWNAGSEVSIATSAASLQGVSGTEVRLLVFDNTIKVWIDGVLTFDVWDETIENLPGKVGICAFNNSAASTTIRFRSLRSMERVYYQRRDPHHASGGDHVSPIHVAVVDLEAGVGPYVLTQKSAVESGTASIRSSTTVFAMPLSAFDGYGLDQEEDQFDLTQTNYEKQVTQIDYQPKDDCEHLLLPYVQFNQAQTNGNGMELSPNIDGVTLPSGLWPEINYPIGVVRRVDNTPGFIFPDLVHLSGGHKYRIDVHGSVVSASAGCGVGHRLLLAAPMRRRTDYPSFGVDITELYENAVDQTSYTGATLTPGSNKLLVAVVASGAASTNTESPTVTGWSLSWTKIADQVVALNGARRITVWIADSGASPGSGALTATWSTETQANYNHILHEVSGVLRTGVRQIKIVDSGASAQSRYAGAFDIAPLNPQMLVGYTETGSGTVLEGFGPVGTWTRGALVDQGVRAMSYHRSLTDSATFGWQTDRPDQGGAIGIEFDAEVTGTFALEQEGFRFRNDDGSESTATWLAAQDTNLGSRAKLTATRLRFIINETGGGSSSEQYRLEWRVSGGSWAPVN